MCRIFSTPIYIEALYSVAASWVTRVLFVATPTNWDGHSYNNNVSVYYNSGSSSAGLRSDLYRFCYSTLGIPVLYPDSVCYLGSATGIVWT